MEEYLDRSLSLQFDSNQDERICMSGSVIEITSILATYNYRQSLEIVHLFVLCAIRKRILYV